MEIKTILISELADFVKSPLYKNSKNCPITIHRAISQSKNPRADQNDPALILAIEANNIVGYIGFLPDLIGTSKVYWNSCWWVDEAHKSIAIPLLLSFIKKGKEQIILTDFTPHTKTIIDQLNFFNTIDLEDGFRGYLKFNLKEILPQKNEKFNAIKPLLALFDSLVNGINKPKIKALKLNTEEVVDLTETDQQFIAAHSQNELIKRGAKELNWIIKNPWVKNTDKQYNNYHFTASTKSFNTKLVRLFDDNKLVAIVYLREINQQLTLPYFYCEKSYLDQISAFIYNEAVRTNCISITTYQPDLKQLFLKSFKFVIQRDLKKNFAYHKSIQQIIKTPVMLQDGDSDAAFC